MRVERTAVKTDRDPSQTSRNLKRKESIRALLLARNEAEVIAWAQRERNPFRPVTSLLFDSDELVRWRAIEAIGWIARQEFAKDPERVRRFIRRILWLMNDESGGICWNGPEVIGEVLRNVLPLVSEYGQLLPGFFTEEPFEAGSRWAVARVAKVNKADYLPSTNELVTSLAHPNSDIRGFSLIALEALDHPISNENKERLQRDDAILSIYDFESGQLVRKPIAELV
jgi:HEAT repeat protein